MDKKHLKLTKSRITRPMRRIIMAILIGSFFIISPAIILYTAGYRYDFQEKNVRQTGVLSIDIKPTSAQVWLNDIEIKKNIPIRLPNRAPGTYHLKIERETHKTWEKDITISSNQTTYIKDITLLKDATPTEIILDQDGIQNIYGTDNSTNILILTKEKYIYEILAFDTVEKTVTPITRTATQPEISVSPFFDTAYILIKEGLTQTLHLVSFENPNNPTTIAIDSLDLELQWNESNSFEPIYIKEKTEIKKISLNGTASPVSQTTSSLWYVDSDENTWELKDKNLKQKNENLSIYIDEEIEDIFHINKDRMILKSKDGFVVAQYTENTTHDTHTIFGDPTYFHRDTQEWWFMTEWELVSVYADGNSNLLNRSGEKLTHVTLLDEDGVILFVTDEKIKTFNPGYYIGHDLFDGNTMQATPLLKQRELYFLRSLEGKNKLYQLDY
ncbi:hypothetical protein C0581_00335 [Candidatus Parcubacteria bacterium]|nr:MAG: hypothetical protein C0581_00335 [Candidatus Parcubacteria bacterium]